MKSDSGIRSLARLATGVTIIAALYFASSVLIPITLALFLSLLLAPLVNIGERAGLSRAPAASLAIVVAIASMLILGWAIGRQMADLVADLPRYETAIVTKIGSLEDSATGWANRLTSGFRRVDRAEQPPTLPPTGPGQASPPPSPLVVVTKIVSPVLSPLATLSIVVVVALFILLQKEDLRARIILLFGKYDLSPGNLAIDDASRGLSRYFLTRLIINSAYGLVIAASLFLIGVPKPLVWGILALILRFIPYVGWVAAAAVPFALAAAVDPGWSMVLWTVLAFVVTETITGQFIEPVVFGHSTGLSPFAVVVAALFWGWLWGPVGLVLSTPLTLCLVVLGRHFAALRFLDVMLGDQPPAEPAGRESP